MFDVFLNLVTDEKSKLFYMQLVAKRRSVNNRPFKLGALRIATVRLIIAVFVSMKEEVRA